jgi:hypothetical protein
MSEARAISFYSLLKELYQTFRESLQLAPMCWLNVPSVPVAKLRVRMVVCVEFGVFANRAQMCVTLLCYFLPFLSAQQDNVASLMKSTSLS